MGSRMALTFSTPPTPGTKPRWQARPQGIDQGRFLARRITFHPPITGPRISSGTFPRYFRLVSPLGEAAESFFALWHGPCVGVSQKSEATASANNWTTGVTGPAPV